MIIADLLSRAALLIESDSARLDVELLLCAVLDKDRSYLFTWPEKALADDQLAQFNGYFDRRLAGEPIAHILGEREFWSLALKTNASTLIPRPDTERLVELVLECTDSVASEPLSLLDLGTGTGAIALALASEYRHWHIAGVDQSSEAVDLAGQNGRSLGLTQVDFWVSDWFLALADKRFDIIVSNPPYIDPVDPHLTQGDVRFEPRSALTAGNGGMADIEHIAEQARSHLQGLGLLAFEHGYDQGQKVRDCLEQLGYQSIATVQDYGGNDRCTYGYWHHCASETTNAE